MIKLMLIVLMMCSLTIVAYPYHQAMDIASWKNTVVVTREETLRLYFIGKDVSNLNSRESLTTYAEKQYYGRRYHDLVSGGDTGYIVYNDVSKERYAYVLLHII